MKELQKRDERLTVETNELALERERLERREETAAGLEGLYQRKVGAFNAKLAKRHEEHRLEMEAKLEAGQKSYHEELRADFSRKCKVQEDKFKERRSELEAEKRSLRRNLDRVRRERDDERDARRRAAEEVGSLREELASLHAQVALVAEQAAERQATAAQARELSRQFQDQF